MKEEDIRPAEIFARYLELSRLDAETYFRDRSEFAEIACPGCGNGASKPAFEKAGFTYVVCGTCGTLFVSPRPRQAQLDAFYSDSPSATYWAESFFPASFNARREKIFAPRAARVLELLDARSAPPHRIIDVGAGYGLFLEQIERIRPGLALEAVEPGVKLAEQCRARGYLTLQSTAEQADAWTGRGDLVVCFEVLEHVHDTEQFVRALARLACAGGYVLISSLCVDGFDIQVLWDRSKGVSPPHHLNFLSIKGFRILFERCGIESVDVLTPGQLDVDIVMNALKDDPAILDGQRFLRQLLEHRGEAEHRAFQVFLREARLSSHAWVLGRVPTTAAERAV